jgi:peptide/nickel transport system substrate-binding protein
MEEVELRALIEDVRAEKLPRRRFIERMVGLGLTAPMASMLLMHSGIAQTQPAPVYKPTKRGGGGALRVLWWQGATLLQPHFANGTKDQEGSRIFYEPLAIWDNDGNLVPILAAEIPSRENGGLAADGKSVTWKLKKGVTWHDGKPFTADDCVFTWEYAKDPATAAVTIGVYKDVVVEKVDANTIRVTFAKPTPFWATAFVAAEGMVLPKHVFGPYAGAKSREAPANLKPVGTGPYKFVDFKPGDIVRGEINKDYHMANRPYFDTIEMKGGGDATSAARAVLQTGEYDYAWNLQVEDEVLKRMEAGGKGKVHIVPGGDIEFIQLNITDPWNEVDGERGSVKSKHFAFSDPKVREAMALLCDKKSMQEFIYGRTGFATGNFMNNPPRFRSKITKWEFNVDKANQILDAAGW